jgi:hypothetical protein
MHSFLTLAILAVVSVHLLPSQRSHDPPSEKIIIAFQKMAEGQAPAGKRPAAHPLTTARGKFAKAHQEQLEIEARLQESFEVLQTRAAGIVKALRKGITNKAYQAAWTRMQMALRDRLCEGSTRLVTRKEIDDLLAGVRPPGSTTYLFRWALKRATAPIEEMLVIECTLYSTRTEDTEHVPCYDDLTGQLYLEYHGQRIRFNELPSLRIFLTYVEAPEVDTLSDDQLTTLCNDFLLHLTQDVIRMTQVLVEAASQEFTLTNIYYQWILSDIRNVQVPH